MRPSFLITLAAVLAGCGLVIDVSPPDPLVRMDAGVRDAARGDSGPLDAGETDAGALDAGESDAGADACEGVEDGAACGEEPPRLCRAGLCVLSRCGDGFIDARNTEECDDANEMSGDGCEPGACVPSCRNDDGCLPVGDPACASAFCDASVCRSSVLPEGSGCTTPLGEVGACRGGACVPGSCGDGFLSSGEECDDGNAIANDGCEPDCQITCTTDSNCADGLFCNGIERCVSLSGDRRACEAGEPPTPSPCYVCDETSGTLARLDADGDGFFPSTCGGEDCDDGNPSRHPGAPDLASPGNGIDDDCDGLVDEDVVVECWRDADHDGVGTSSLAVTADGGSCPIGYVPARPSAGDASDCDDANPDVYPGQTAWFATSLCGGTVTPRCFDYDCSGADELRWGTLVCADSGGSCTGQGFVGAAPPCGAEATFSACTSSAGRCLVAGWITLVPQQCH